MTKFTCEDVENAMSKLSLGTDYCGNEGKLKRPISDYEFKHVLTGGNAYIPVVSSKCEIATVCVDGRKRKATVLVTGSVFDSVDF